MRRDDGQYTVDLPVPAGVDLAGAEFDGSVLTLRSAANVYGEDGRLTARPGLRSVPLEGADILPGTVFPGGENLICGVEERDGAYGAVFIRVNAGGQEYEILPSAPVTGKDSPLFAVEADRLYLFTKEGNVKRLADGAWETLGEEDFHIPTVYTSCEAGPVFKGETSEAPNILTPLFKTVYTAAPPSGEPVRMSYYVPGAGASAAEQIKVTLTLPGRDAVTHTVAGSGGLFSEAEDGADGFKVTVTKSGEGLTVDFYSGGEYANASPADYLPNNLEITAAGPTSPLREALFAARGAVLHGGRLFLCAGRAVGERGVFWSATDNPLYFPETCRAALPAPVTCMGEQGGSLFAFTASACYRLRGAALPTARDRVLGEEVTFPASDAGFSAETVHSGAGCDLPRTLKLCRNRLLWATKAGEVYTLVSKTPTAAKAVYKISGPVDGALTGLGDGAFAAVRGEEYMLIWGRRAAVARCDSYGFVYISSEEKRRGPGSGVPWWLWEFPAELEAAAGDMLLARWSTGAALSRLVPGEADRDGSEESPVGFALETPALSAGDGFRRKKLYSVAVRGEFSSPVTLTVTSEAGATSAELPAGEPGELPTVAAAFPGLPPARLYRLKFEGRGALSLNAVRLRCRMIDARGK